MVVEGGPGTGLDVGNVCGPGPDSARLSRGAERLTKFVSDREVGSDLIIKEGTSVTGTALRRWDTTNLIEGLFEGTISEAEFEMISTGLRTHSGATAKYFYAKLERARVAERAAAVRNRYLAPASGALDAALRQGPGSSSSSSVDQDLDEDGASGGSASGSRDRVSESGSSERKTVDSSPSNESSSSSSASGDKAETAVPAPNATAVVTVPAARGLFKGEGGAPTSGFEASPAPAGTASASPKGHKRGRSDDATVVTVSPQALKRQRRKANKAEKKRLAAIDQAAPASRPATAPSPAAANSTRRKVQQTLSGFFV